LITVSEDDIVLTTLPVQAVSSLPRNADVLYVEWCFDLCEESRFHTGSAFDFRKQKGAPHFNDFSLSLCQQQTVRNELSKFGETQHLG
jgi:hypothetical protein